MAIKEAHLLKIKDHFIAAINAKILDDFTLKGSDVKNLLNAEFSKFFIDSKKYFEILLLLSDKEIRFLALRAKGFKTKEIADKLYVTERTLRYYKTNILEKMEMQSLDQVLVTMRDIGII